MVYRNFIAGIKNLIYYFKVVWKDRSYDDSFIFDILERKLTKTARAFREADFYKGQIRDAERIELCCRLIDRIREGYYSCEVNQYYDQKFSTIDGKLHIETTSERFNDYLAKYPLMVKKNKKDGSKKESLAYNISYLNEERAKHLLFKILERHIQSWWW